MYISQFKSFTYCLIVGIIISVIFDCFRSLRKTIKTSNVITYLEDLLFWCISGLVVIFTLNSINYGEIRIYMILGIIIGCMLYFFTISKIFLKINVKILTKMKIIILKVYTTIAGIIKKIIMCLSNFNKKNVKKNKN